MKLAAVFHHVPITRRFRNLAALLYNFASFGHYLSTILRGTSVGLGKCALSPPVYLFKMVLIPNNVTNQCFGPPGPNIRVQNSPVMRFGACSNEANIVQHCWPTSVARCWTKISSNSNQHYPTSSNIVFKRGQHVASNNVA